MCDKPNCHHGDPYRRRPVTAKFVDDANPLADRYRDMGFQHAVFADVAHAGNPVEMFSVEKQKNNFVLASGDDLIDVARNSLMVESTQWLPFFSEAYNISAKLEDYVVVPVIIMPSDLPNRNCIAFPYEELAKANPEFGLLSYQTWRAKPTFIDHVNKDHTKAKGIIFSSVFRPMQGVHGDLYKIICLAGYDRTRDPALVNQILTGERNSYSMGAWTTHFTCSVCGAVHRQPTEPGCNHVKIGMTSFTMHDGKLGYLDSRNPVGFELSSVTVPAYQSAVTDHHATIKMWQ